MLTTLHSHFFVVPTSTNTLVIIICQSASRQAIVVLPCLDTSGPAQRRLDSRKGPAEHVAPWRHGHRPTRVRAQPQRACHHSDAPLSSQLLCSLGPNKRYSSTQIGVFQIEILSELIRIKEREYVGQLAK